VQSNETPLALLVLLEQEAKPVADGFARARISAALNECGHARFQVRG
jgi:hypothetical protein